MWVTLPVRSQQLKQMLDLSVPHITVELLLLLLLSFIQYFSFVKTVLYTSFKGIIQYYRPSSVALTQLVQISQAQHEHLLCICGSYTT